MSTRDGDFDWPGLDGGSGPARPLADAAADAMVQAALGAALAAPTPRTGLPRWKVVATVAAVAGLGGTAAIVASRADRPTPVTSVPAPTHAPRVGAAAPVIEPLESPAPPQLEPAAPPPVRRERPAPVAARATDTATIAIDLLRRANDERAQRHWAEAEALYAKALAAEPAGPGAATAAVAAGQLRLDHLTDAATAVKLFETALRSRPRGALAEDARFGLAEAHRALGQRDAEAAALRTFLAAFPDSLMAGRAQQRLREIEKP